MFFLTHVKKHQILSVPLRLCVKFSFVLLLLNVCATAQTYTVLKDPKNEQVVFKGPVTYADLTKEPTFDWLKSGIDAYKPKQGKIKILKERLTPANYSIMVFLGTWCSDTHDMLPQFFKVLNEINYPITQVTMYGVERDKTTRSEDVKKYSITNLPTIILLKDGKETGRITETVNKSVEADLVKIVNP